MATKAERDLILDMLASGCINPAEAKQLFDAIERCVQPEQVQADDLEGFELFPVITRSIEAGVEKAAELVSRTVVWELGF